MTRGRGMTFAEVFVVLALIFLVQTIINFSLLVDTPEPPLNDLIVENIFQVPSGGDQTDHIRYFAVGEVALLFSPSGCGGNGMSPSTVRSRLDRDGRCLSVDLLGRYREYRADREGELDEFLEAVEARYDLVLSVLQGEGLQTSFVAVREHEKALSEPIIRVGLCVCQLDPTEANLRSAPEWGLGSPLPFPHPLVTERLTVNEEDLVEERAVSFLHEGLFEPKGLSGDVIGLVSGDQEGEGLVFEATSCELASPLRTSVLRELTITPRE